MDKQRLFRLTSTSNDGKFATTFNEDIEIPANSEIALQSLSFDRNSDELIVPKVATPIQYGINQTEDLSVADGIALFSATVPEKADKTAWKANTEGEQFLTALAKELNVSMPEQNDSDIWMADDQDFDYSISQGCQWNAYLDNDDFVNIECKTQPPARPAQALWKNNMTQANVVTYKGATVYDGAGDIDTLSRPTGGVGAVDDYNDSHVYGEVRMGKGIASLNVRVAQNASTSLTRVAFTVGLTDSDGIAAFKAGTFADTNILFAVRMKGNASSYEYKQGGNPFALVDGAGGLLPELVANVGGGSNTNDVIRINIGDSIGTQAQTDREIDMSIHQETAGKTVAGVVGDVQQVNQDKDLHFFIAFAEDSTKVEVDMFEVDLDPYAYTPLIDTFDTTQTSSLDAGGTAQILRNGFEAQSSQALVPIPLSRRIGALDLTKEVSNFLGYDIASNNYLNDILPTSFDASASYIWKADRRSEFQIRSKNYLVLFNNIPLDSYDTFARYDIDQRNANSGGSRQNILATVPAVEDLVTGSSITQLAYEPGTLNYISMSNRSPLITRSLRCEILTAVYGDININGLASMTVLIRDKKD